MALGLGCDDEGNKTNPDALDSTGDTTDDTSGESFEAGDAYFPQSICSGDPKPNSVILWARVEDAASSGDLSLLLDVAADELFTELVTINGATRVELTAQADFDHCVKVRLADLEPATTYYYRFIYEVGGLKYVTHTGRTKTAPAADADVPVRFAWASCQDYNGKYYNTYKRMLREELDFFVHLGDYVYETTGDPQFQTTTPDRVVKFQDEAGAIVFNEGTEEQFFAAKSLSNYRDLYKTYRSDKNLQAVHEKLPMIAIWDDHEYSDDCFGATATYYDGHQDEYDESRRKNANQAWFEYMPVDYEDPAFVYDASKPYLQDLTIYRSFEYGAHMQLVVTDLRSYRADHVIAEDAFPGTVLVEQAELIADLGALPGWADPYVNIDDYAAGIYVAPLKTAAADPASVAGLVSASYINVVVAALNETLEPANQLPLIDATELATFERGLTNRACGKLGAYAQTGSRYLVVKDPFHYWCGKHYASTSGASETVMGATQRTWFLDKMKNSTKTWKVWGNEYMLTQRAVDLTQNPALEDGSLFKNKFLLSAEDWDGFPNERDFMLSELAAVGNVVALTGDIHAFFTGTPLVRDDMSKRIVEFTGAGISSGSYRQMLSNVANSDPALLAAGAALLALGIESLLKDPATKPNPPMAYTNTDTQGFSIAEVDATKFKATYYAISPKNVGLDLADADVDAEFKLTRFYTEAGSNELYMEDAAGGAAKRWDPPTMSWV